MTNPDYTAIQLIVDRSGSMERIRVEAENSINSFIKSQRVLPGEATIQIIEFDDSYDVVVPSTNIQNDISYKLIPGGLTALNDAIGRGVQELGSQLAALTEDLRPAKVIVVIITDGAENASREFTQSAVREMISHQKDVYGWDFLFLAANQDAVLTASAYDIDSGSAISFGANAAGVRGVTATMDSYVEGTRSGRGYEISDEDRHKSMG